MSTNLTTSMMFTFATMATGNLQPRAHKLMNIQYPCLAVELYDATQQQ